MGAPQVNGSVPLEGIKVVLKDLELVLIIQLLE